MLPSASIVSEIEQAAYQLLGCRRMWDFGTSLQRASRCAATGGWITALPTPRPSAL